MSIIISYKNKQWNWKYISKRKYILKDIDFIKLHKNRLNWYFISRYQNLSEDFITEFQDYVDWYYISKKSRYLSENFIRIHQNRIHWYFISQYQNLSEKFKEEFKNNLKCF